MKKPLTLFTGLLLFFTAGYGQVATDLQQSVTIPHEINTKIDNIEYWVGLAEKGYIPFNPTVQVPPATQYLSKDGSTLTHTMSSDIVIYSESGVTQSENSTYVDPLNAQHALNSNNSEHGGGFIYGADYFNTANGGSTWTGSKLGAGGGNDGDPAAAIDLLGRQFVGFINSSGGQSVARSDNGSTWSTSVLANNGTGTYDLLDKNHLAVDNTNSAYTGYVYSAWTQFVSGSTDNNDIVFSRSTNHGVNWSAPINISNGVSAGAFNHGVNIQVGPSGQVHCAWVIYDVWGATTYENAIGFAKSTNGGSTFAAPSRILSNIKGIRPNPNSPTSNATGKNMRVNSFPSMAVDISGGTNNGNIYIVWSNVGTPGTNTGTNVSVYCIRSTNGGTSWSSPVKVNQGSFVDGYASYFPWITCDPVTGKLFCVFYDDRNLGTTSTAIEAWMACSEDGGVTWKDFRVSDVSFTPIPITGLASGYFGDYLSVSARNGWVYPTWTDNRSGSALTYVSPIHFSNYCVASGGCDEYISNVTIGSINNSSTCEGYQNFTNLSTTIPINSSAGITVTNGTPSYSADQCGIWVD